MDRLIIGILVALLVVGIALIMTAIIRYKSEIKKKKIKWQ